MKGKTKIAAVILSPFLVIGGMSLNDVKLADGNKFANQKQYEEYRDKLFSEDTTFNNFHELITVLDHENVEELIKTQKDLNDFKKNSKEFLNNKIKFNRIYE